jgi:multidrug efflux pump subunit AcrA (membrane-fusion protein)
MALAVTILSSCGKKEEKAIDPGIPVGKGEIREVVEEIGQLAPLKSVDVRSEISGQLTEVLVDVGDRVMKGQVVARVRGGYEAEDYRIAEIRSPTEGVVIDRDLGPNGKRRC